MSKLHVSRVFSLSTFLLAASACGATEPEADFVVSPGDDARADLQRAFSDAQPGDTILIKAGTYTGLTDELRLSTSDVTVRGEGMDETILDFTEQDNGGNGILITGDGVTFEDLTVEHTPGDGIRADQVNDVTFNRIKVFWNAADNKTHGAYGLYPVGCDGVVIDGSEVWGARDAGIYVGQSNDIRVINSAATKNVAGIEIENSFDAEVEGNEAYGNTGGILVFNLPGLEQVDGARTRVFNNDVHDNDLANFGIEGTTVAEVPKGTGMLLLAAREVEIHDNEIRNNVGPAIIGLHYYQVLFGNYQDPDFDPWTRTIYIHDNNFENNGNDPQGWVIDLAGVGEGQQVPEILFDGAWPDADGACVTQPPSEAERFCAVDNFRSDGSSVGYRNFGICNNFMGSDDIAEVDCRHEPIPPLG